METVRHRMKKRSNFDLLMLQKRRYHASSSRGQVGRRQMSRGNTLVLSTSLKNVGSKISKLRQDLKKIQTCSYNLFSRCYLEKINCENMRQSEFWGVMRYGFQTLGHSGADWWGNQTVWECTMMTTETKPKIQFWNSVGNFFLQKVLIGLQSFLMKDDWKFLVFNRNKVL